ncbi:MAG: hypothetical protein AB1635_01415 [Acidobacteriota bacterium]
MTAVTVEDFSRQENAWADGAWTATFTIRARWLEHRRVDVTDADGRTIGQLVLLRDDGSSWTAEASGTARARSGRHALELRGTGEGGPVLQAGWVYTSLANDDPLADVLPNGTYAAWSYAALDVEHVYTERDVRIVQRSPGEVPPQEMVGILGTRLPVFWWNEQVPVPERIPVDTVRRMMAAGGEYPYADRERRTLVDGRMRGSFTATGRGSEAGITRSLTWDLHRRLAVDCTLGEVDASWRPTVDEQMRPVTVRASIDPALGLEGRFRFTLAEVSREPGYALNVGTGTGLDLRFTSSQPAPFGAPETRADGYAIESNDAGTESTVSVTAYDFGAWGRLRAEVIIDGEWYGCRTAGGDDAVTIPVDENGNRIWDTWERNTGIWDRPASEDADDDEGAAADHPGDGLSNYEEYRGLMVRGGWVSTHPRYRELFVFDAIGEGIGHFGASGVSTYLIEQDELAGDRTINPNRNYATRGPQRALRLEDARLDPGVLGIVLSGVGTPNTTDRVFVDTLQATGEALESTIAHELGHGVGVEHHGAYDEGRCNGGEVGLISLWRGAYSGDRACVMAYGSARYYRAWDGRCYAWTWPEEWGTTFCLTKSGSGINAGERRVEDGHPLPVAGDATYGACRHAIRLR